MLPSPGSMTVRRHQASLLHGGKLVLEIVEIRCQQRPAGPSGACHELNYASGWKVPLGQTFHW